MTVNKDIFLAETDQAKEAFAIEDLVFSVQIALQKVMHKQGVGHKELAERLGMSPARVSQIFADNGPNLTLKTIARIQHALGKEFVFVEKTQPKKLNKQDTSIRAHSKPSLVMSYSEKPSAWPIVSNENSWSEEVADAA
jgi:DNA-binding Xre family transcriptional regulator